MASALSMTTMRARARAHRGWRAACVAGAWLAAASASAAVGGPLEGDARLESDGHRRRLLASSTATAHDLALRFSVPQPSPLSQPTKRATASVQLQPFAAARWLPPAPSASPAALDPHVVAALPTKPIQREYELQGVVGEGGFGCVHAARHRATNTRVALKRVFKASTTRAKFLQEVAILRHVCSANDSASGSGASGVLQLRDAFETADAYVLVTELVAGGELFDAVVETGALAESCASTLTRDVAATLAFLHAKRVVHGDVKPENILLSDRGSSTRLIDFGQAFRDDSSNGHQLAEQTLTVGTTAYAAPEVLSRGDASAAADAWALGVVLYIMLCGRHPFDETNDASDDEIAARIRVGAFACESARWQRLSAPARDLVQRLLTVDPRVRLTAEQVLQHEWIVRNSSSSRQAMEA